MSSWAVPPSILVFPVDSGLILITVRCDDILREGELTSTQPRCAPSVLRRLIVNMVGLGVGLSLDIYR